MPSAPTRTQGLTEGAILAALVALFAVAGQYVPPLILASTFLCPLPLAVLVIRHGIRVAGIAGIASALVAASLAGPLVGVLILIAYAPMGIALGTGARRGWPATRVVVVGALVASVSIAANFFGLAGLGNLSTAELLATLERSTMMSVALGARLGIPQAQLDLSVKQMRGFATALPYLMPVMLVSAAASASWLNYEVGRRVLTRFGYHLNPLPPAGTWGFPGAVVWLIPLGFLVAFVGELPRVPAALGFVGGSLQAGGVFAFLLQGLVASWVILGNYDLTRLERGIAFAMAFSLASQIPLINGILVVVGALDMTLHVRDRWGLQRPRAGSVGAKP